MTPDDIVSTYPTITLADVYAALAYYWDHRDEIRARIRADEEFADLLRQQTPSRLQEKLKQLHAGNDTLPS